MLKFDTKMIKFKVIFFKMKHTQSPHLVIKENKNILILVQWSLEAKLVHPRIK
jgi:hypothetical protein